jgi:hypothetical protein
MKSRYAVTQSICCVSISSSVAQVSCPDLAGQKKQDQQKETNRGDQADHVVAFRFRHRTVLLR